MQNHGNLVAATLATQFVRPQVTAAEEEEGKAQLTRQAAYEINRLDPNVGLLKKPGGNQVYGMSVDVVVDRATGDWADIATAQGVGNPIVTIAAHWIQQTGSPPGENWIQPTAVLASLTGPMERTGTAPGPGPDPGPGPTPPSDNTEVLAKLDAMDAKLDRLQETQTRDTATIIARDDLNTEKIQQQLAQIVEDFEATAKKVLAIWMATQRPDQPPVEGGGDGGQQPTDLLLLLLKAYIENRPQRGAA